MSLFKYILPSCMLLATVQPATAQRSYNKIADAAATHVYMVKVQGGNFDLGSDDEATDRRPAHNVKLADFYIGAYEVTQEQWKAIMGNNPSKVLCDECPVTDVSYDEVLVFIQKLNAATGKKYRLPTEAEWEYAARSGNKERLIKTSKAIARGGVNGFFAVEGSDRVPDRELTGKKYSGSRMPQDVAWYVNNSKDRPHAIGRKKANDLGIYDMSGNVEEWCADWYALDYGTKHEVENPKGPSGGNARVVRGGGWNSTREEIVVTRRAAYLPGTRGNTVGFRLAMDM